MRSIEQPYTAEQVMQAVHNRDYALWMDSADTHHPDSNWSFVMCDPVEVISFKNGIITHNSASKTKTIAARTPFEFLKQRIKQYQFEHNTEITTPFTGGAAGYFGYDLGQSLESLPSSCTHNPDIPDMIIGVYTQIYAYNHRSNIGYLISHEGCAQEQAFLEHLKNIDPNASFRARPYEPPPLSWHSNMSKDEYIEKTFKIIDYIYAGEIYQANLSQRFEATFPEDFEPFEHYRHLRHISPAPFAGYFQAKDITLASASPERFLRCDPKGYIETKPIKGTQPRSPVPEQDNANKKALLNSKKDYAENIMIVDLLRNDLSKCAKAHSVKVPKLCALESFEHVHHLVSTITATLSENRDCLDLLSGAFPGGSITGAPKLRAQEIIEELETHARGPYCGSLGYIGFDGQMDSNILIRTLVYNHKTVSFNVGGGIVADSQPEAEYQETLDKAAGLLQSFKTQEKAS